MEQQRQAVFLQCLKWGEDAALRSPKKCTLCTFKLLYINETSSLWEAENTPWLIWKMKNPVGGKLLLTSCKLLPLFKKKKWGGETRWRRICIVAENFSKILWLYLFHFSCGSAFCVWKYPFSLQSYSCLYCNVNGFPDDSIHECVFVYFLHAAFLRLESLNAVCMRGLVKCVFVCLQVCNVCYYKLITVTLVCVYIHIYLWVCVCVCIYRISLVRSALRLELRYAFWMHMNKDMAVRSRNHKTKCCIYVVFGS